MAHGSGKLLLALTAVLALISNVQGARTLQGARAAHSAVLLVDLIISGVVFKRFPGFFSGYCTARPPHGTP